MPQRNEEKKILFFYLFSRENKNTFKAKKKLKLKLTEGLTGGTKNSATTK